MKTKISIPVGAKMTVNGQKIIIEYDEVDEAKWVPKIGEVVKTSDEQIGIYAGKGRPLFAALKRGEIVIDSHFAKTISTTTHADRCTFFEALNKAGYKWKAKKSLLTKKEEKFEPQEGDFVTCEKNTWGNKWFMIWGGVKISGLTSEKFGYSPSNKGTTIGGFCCRADDAFRPMTDAEKQQLFSALHAASKDWDAEKKEVVELKWKPKKNEWVYVALPEIIPLYFMYKSNGEEIQHLFDRNLIFRTKEEAITRAKQMLDTPPPSPRILTADELIFLSNIAKTYPFSFKDVCHVYDKTHSFAKTELALVRAAFTADSLDEVLTKMS